MKAASVNHNQDSSWVAACRLDQLPENVGQCVLLNKRQIAIFRISDCNEIYALDNLDPFSNASVLSRGLVGDLNGVLVVASPIYKQHFDLATGQCLEDETVTVASYSVRCSNGIVEVQIESNIQ